MSATWMPRAARLVATSVGMRPLRNPSSTRSRSCWPTLPWSARAGLDRKSTRLNSSHSQISYAVFCLKKKNISVRLALPEPVQRSPSIPVGKDPDAVYDRAHRAVYVEAAERPVDTRHQPRQPLPQREV